MSVTRRIEAPPASVWATLADFDRIVDWAPAVDHSSWMTAQQEGEGAARRVQVGSMTLIETVTVWEPERTLAYTLDGLPPVVSSVVNRWDLEPDGDATVVTLTSDITPGPRPPMKVAARAVGRRMDKENAVMIDGLAQAVTNRERAS